MGIWKKTHSARPVPNSFAQLDRLPQITPIVGDTIVYHPSSEDHSHHIDPAVALLRLQQGQTMYYTTWMYDE